MTEDPLWVLAREMSPAARMVSVREHLADFGWRIAPVWAWLTWLGWRHSFTAPWRVIYVDAATEAAGVGIVAAVIAHEATHARQLERARWRAMWALMYLVSPWHRRRVEAEAEAWEAAMSGAIGHASATGVGLANHVVARALGGWRWPHFTGGDRAELLAAVADKAADLLSAGRRG